MEVTRLHQGVKLNARRPDALVQRFSTMIDLSDYGADDADFAVSVLEGLDSAHNAHRIAQVNDSDAALGDVHEWRKRLSTSLTNALFGEMWQSPMRRQPDFAALLLDHLDRYLRGFSSKVEHGGRLEDGEWFTTVCLAFIEVISPDQVGWFRAASDGVDAIWFGCSDGIPFSGSRLKWRSDRGSWVAAAGVAAAAGMTESLKGMFFEAHEGDAAAEALWDSVVFEASVVS